MEQTTFNLHESPKAGKWFHNGAAIGKGERTVLIVAAQYPDGVSDAQIAVMTGYKSTSRNEFKKKLIRDGLVERRGDTIVVTDAGVNFLGQDYRPLPTGPELRTHWNERLTGGEAVIFKIAVERYPEQLHKTELQELTNYKATSVNEFCKHLAARKLKPGATMAETVIAEGICADCGEKVAKNLNALNGVEASYEACVVEDNYPVGRGVKV